MDIDIDGDGTPDLITKDTNGHTVYVSLKWIVGGVTAIVGVIGAWFLV